MSRGVSRGVNTTSVGGVPVLIRTTYMVQGFAADPLIVDLIGLVRRSTCYVSLSPSMCKGEFHPTTPRLMRTWYVFLQLKLPPRSQRLRMGFWKVGPLHAIAAPC